MTIQKDGQLLPDDFTGAIDCCKVVVISGKLLNIITKPIDPSKLFRVRVEYDLGGKEVKRQWWFNGKELTAQELEEHSQIP